MPLTKRQKTLMKRHKKELTKYKRLMGKLGTLNERQRTAKTPKTQLKYHRKALVVERQTITSLEKLDSLAEQIEGQ